MALSAGATTELDATGSATGADCARISDSQMLVIYRDAAGVLGARVCDINTSLKTITPNAQSSLTFGFNMNELTIARLSSTKFIFASIGRRAAVLNVTGTSVAIGPIFTLTDSSNFGVQKLLPLTATTALLVYQYGTGASVDGAARVLSIDGSDNISEGSRLQLATHPTTEFPQAATTYDTSTGVYFFQDRSDNFYLKGQLFSISGTTLALTGGAQTLYNSNDGWENALAAANLSSSEVATAHDINDAGAEALACHVISLSGSTLTAGSTLELANTEFIEPEAGTFTNSTTVLFTGNDGTTSRTTQLIKDGTTLSHTASDFINVSENDTIVIDSLKKIADDFALVVTLGTVDGTVLGSDSVLPSGGDLTVSAMPKPVDVGADGDFLYISVLDSSNFPVLIKFSTDLDADGTTVFEPGAGDNIGVECGRFNSDVVWVAGQFDGTNVVEYSDDGGSTFSVVDDGTIGGVRAFVMGPDSDNRIMVFDEDNGDILETRDGGTTWTAINASVTPEINAIGRLGENVEESVFGNDGGANNSINYSVNSGDDLEDYQTGVYPNANATGVIVN